MNLKRRPIASHKMPMTATTSKMGRRTLFHQEHAADGELFAMQVFVGMIPRLSRSTSGSTPCLAGTRRRAWLEAPHRRGQRWDVSGVGGADAFP